MVDEWNLFKEEGVLPCDTLLRTAAKEYLRTHKLAPHQTLWAAEKIVSSICLTCFGLVAQKLRSHMGTPAVIVITTDEFQEALEKID